MHHSAEAIVTWSVPWNCLSHKVICFGVTCSHSEPTCSHRRAVTVVTVTLLSETDLADSLQRLIAFTALPPGCESTAPPGSSGRRRCPHRPQGQCRRDRELAHTRAGWEEKKLLRFRPIALRSFGNSCTNRRSCQLGAEAASTTIR